MRDDKLWVLALVGGLGMGPALTGCSEGESDANPGSGGGGASGSGGLSGSGGASGSSGTSGGGAGGSPENTSYTFLTGDAALPSATPAPAEYTKTCALCHAAAGQGVSPLGPEIRHPPAPYLSWIVRHGRTGTTMLAYPDIPDATVAEIQTWLAAMPKPTSGEQLYLDFCGNCHGPTGEGGALSTYVKGKVKADLLSTVRLGIAPEDPSMHFSYMPPASLAELSDAELDQIATYLGAIP